MRVSEEVEEIIDRTVILAKNANFEFVVPELLLYVICQNATFARAFENCGGNVRELDYHLKRYLEENMESRREADSAPQLSQDMLSVLDAVREVAQNSGKDVVELSHILCVLYDLRESYAVYYMLAQGVERAELLSEMNVLYREPSRKEDIPAGHGRGSGGAGGGEDDPHGGNGGLAKEEADGEPEEEWEQEGERRGGRSRKEDWQQYAVCLNDITDQFNPLIGREEELERTMQILCRREKNNPLHIGEPGVGKTAVTYGLARLLEEDRVPGPLRGAKIFSLDLGSLLAGTQYRGDFEKRFKRVMDSICGQEKPIVYIDEIHNIVGAGAVGGGAFDISNMLKPYLERGQVRFIGATTYGEYKKHFEKSRGLVRRFQNIDVREPDIPDCVRILEGLKAGYERFHGVVYEEGVLEYAAEMSAKYINERFLPDKAVDLMDEAGAYRRLHPLKGERQPVGKELIDELLSRICRVPRQAVESDETAVLATLKERLRSHIFGQDEAVSQVVNAVKFSKAGLLEEGKPLASLLFVGPTGVGKTEIARCLAKELGISLVRFDMSEYGEKHAVAKLIGAPAGYVGYEEGGLLTEEIRRHPHAVLLLDEIEKAHPDIYNILLQVMDYATLTDNQGRKADFRNVILIMTSNAGASRVGKPGIGFGGTDTGTEAILEEVKRIFQPEFRNRLTKTVAFNGMDGRMAGQIVDKKLGELGELLLRKNIELSADDMAREWIQKKGISAEFGAREIERVIRGEIKPLLVDEILFGSLKEGGKCLLTCHRGAFAVENITDKEKSSAGISFESQ